jgi:hypothetical protein
MAGCEVFSFLIGRSTLGYGRTKSQLVKIQTIYDGSTAKYALRVFVVPGYLSRSSVKEITESKQVSEFFTGKGEFAKDYFSAWVQSVAVRVLPKNE